MRDLTLVEKAVILRITRRARTELLSEHERMKELATRGDKIADAAARTLDAEITILDAAIKKIWEEVCDGERTPVTRKPSESSG